MQVTLPNGEIATCEAVKIYAWLQGADLEVDRSVRVLQASNEGMTYSAAMHAVLADDEHLKNSYAQEAVRGRPHRAAIEIGGESPGMKVHRLTQQNMRESGRSYADAMHVVLDLNPELKTAFARSAA